MDLDMMFGSFNPNQASEPEPPKQTNTIKKLRPAPTPITNLEAQATNELSDNSSIDLEADISEDDDDLCEQEDERLKQEGLAMLNQIQQEKDDNGNAIKTENRIVIGGGASMAHIGYDPSAFYTKTYEYDNCQHEFVAPSGYERDANFKRPKQKPKQYKFTLDKFQDRAVECIERNESVLVAAHTSAGKTAIAEYAIAQSLSKKQRVIYTSPIKALSNQKYRELQEEFGDVGLMTGDVTINETASCLVMTTEILRSMLYNGSEVTREMAWVIFDEVHYMRDKERGVVWEETIILLPEVVKYVFLSATIPNAREFAEWIVKLKKQPCNVVYTDFRPTPLQHYLFPTGAQGIYLVVDEKGQFRENNFAKAIQVIEDDMSIAKIQEKKRDKKKDQQKQTQQQEMKKLISLIVSKGLDPVIVFSFSKRECEQYSMGLKTCDFNTEDEREAVAKIFANAIETLSEDDQQLPQVTGIVQLLKRGIGIHHGGLLPIIKEVIELLFQEGLLKVLFTTETFSMGINMPAKTVVFTSLEKFDGDEYRWITGGEYIQMSGRAGRRGLDDKGITILMANKKLEPDVAKAMLKGKSDSLYSSFHLGYNMLLNMMRIEDLKPEDIIVQSFHQFQNERVLPELKAKLSDSLAEYQAITGQLGDQKAIRHKNRLIRHSNKINRQIKKIVTKPENIVPFFAPGRLVRIKIDKGSDGQTLQDWGWGILVNFTKQKISPKNLQQVGLHKNNELKDILEKNETHYVLDVYLYVQDRLTASNLCQPGNPQKKDGHLGLVPVVLHPSTVHAISTIQINLPAGHNNAQKTVELMYFEILKRFENGNSIPLMDPIKDMDIKSKTLSHLVKAKNQISADLQESSITTLTSAQESQYEKKQELKEFIQSLEASIRKSSDMIMASELVSMKRVMRRLDLADKNDVPTLKGKVAAHISASDEILLTEMLFSGLFNDVDEPAHIASLLSCLVFTEHQPKNAQEGPPKILKNETLGPLFQQLLKIAERVATAMIDSKIPLDKEEYMKKFQSELMELTLSWCQGCTFKELCEQAQNIYEGTIIRAFRRLDELISQLIECAKLIGNQHLKGKFEEAQKGLKRGIVFTASLYL